jgi:hypothetical protein
MKINSRVRIKSGRFFNSKYPEDNLGTIESINGDVASVDMDEYDDLDDGNVIDVKMSDLELIERKS